MARLTKLAATGLVMMLAACAASPAAQPAGRLGGGGDLPISFGRVAVVLVFCLILAAAAAFALKRGGGRVDWSAIAKLTRSSPSAPRLSVVEARRIGLHAELALVRCDDREYLILSSASTQQVIGNVEPKAAS